MMTFCLVIHLSGRNAFAEAFPKEDEEWQFKRPGTPSWNQEDDLPAARGRKSPKSNEAAPRLPDDEYGEVEQEIESQERSYAEEAPRAPKRSRRPAPKVEEPREFEEERELSSTEEPAATRDDAENAATPPAESRLFKVRLGVLGGVSNLKSGEAVTQNFRVEQALTQNFFLGGVVDARVGRYFQVELEGFYGIAPDIEITDAQGLNAQIKKLQQNGVFASAMGRLPIGVITLRAGIGYGMLSLTHYLTANNVASVAVEKVAGPLATAGLEVQLSEFVTLAADYSRTLSAKGTLTGTTDGVEDVNQDTSTASFDRIRVGGYYRFSPRVLAGALFHLRNLTTSLAPHNTTAPTGSEALSQFMFLGMVEL